jgi:hypothetical protein
MEDSIKRKNTSNEQVRALIQSISKIANYLIHRGIAGYQSIAIPYFRKKNLISHLF